MFQIRQTQFAIRAGFAFRLLLRRLINKCHLHIGNNAACGIKHSQRKGGTRTLDLQEHGRPWTIRLWTSHGRQRLNTHDSGKRGGRHA